MPTTFDQVLADLQRIPAANIVPPLNPGSTVGLVSVGTGAKTTDTATIVKPVLYLNGSVVAVGGRGEHVNDSSSLGGISGAFFRYCNAGDTLQPGYTSEHSSATAGFVGDDATGATTYWTVALANRSDL